MSGQDRDYPPPGPQTTCDPGTGGDSGSTPLHMMTCDEAPGDNQHCVVISPSARVV